MTTRDPNKNPPILLDCTLRDGGYYNSWNFNFELITDYLQAMSALATDYVELGFRTFDHNGFKGGCAYTTDSFIRRLNVPSGLKLGVIVNASEILEYPGGIVEALSELFKPASESPLTFVRIACHMHQVKDVLPSSTWLKEQGYIVGINLIQIANCSSDEIEAMAGFASSYPVDVLYFADSTGSMDPSQISATIAALRRNWKGSLGIHAHDSMGLALTNSLRAITDGVTWIDSTVTGMGRGPGNVKTELLAIELAPLRSVSSDLTPLLALVTNHFKPMKIKHGWGTNAYYYLAGKYGIHPSYIQEMLSDSRFDNEDILAVIEYLRRTENKSFSMHALETGRHFYQDKPKGNWAPYSLIAGREVLIIASGTSTAHHRQALEDYIYAAKPVVIALNTQSPICESVIDIRAASHPIRLMTDSAEYLTLPQPLVTPVSMLPESVRASLKDKELLDFGLTIQPDTFVFDKNYCVLPTALVMAYALAIAISGKASRVLLSGFDGYGADDPRSAEVESLLNSFQQLGETPPLLAITPTRYKLPSTSVYSML